MNVIAIKYQSYTKDKFKGFVQKYSKINSVDKGWMNESTSVSRDSEIYREKAEISWLEMYWCGCESKSKQFGIERFCVYKHKLERSQRQWRNGSNSVKWDRVKSKVALFFFWLHILILFGYKSKVVLICQAN
jgi:hypothetical protein